MAMYVNPAREAVLEHGLVAPVKMGSSIHARDPSMAFLRQSSKLGLAGGYSSAWKRQETLLCDNPSQAGLEQRPDICQGYCPEPRR